MRNQDSQDFVWLSFLDSGKGIDSNIRYDIITNLFRGYDKREIVNLISIQDENQSRAIDLTDMKTKAYLMQYLLFCGRYELFLEEAPIHESDTSLVVKAKDHRVDEKYLVEFDRCMKRIGHKQGFLLDEYETFKNCMEQMMNFETVGVDGLFTKFDKNKDKMIDRSEFESYLKGHLSKVVIKFMKHEDQFLRELETSRLAGFHPKYSMKILNSSKALGSDLFRDEVKKNNETAAYAYGIVMPRGDRSLKSIIINERPDLSMKVSYLKQIAEGLDYLHDNNIVHLDLKPLNIVRLKGNQLVIIDLDAAIIVNENSIEYAGSKFSSGYLPPEMFYQLQNDEEKEQFDQYWKEEKASDSPLWNKVDSSMEGCVVKSHMGREKNGNASLPYDRVRASKSMDVWSFGLIMFDLLCGKTFFHLNRDDDVINMQSLTPWTTKAIETQLNTSMLMSDKISMQSAFSLLKKLLVVEPNKRLTMKEVLDDPIFRGLGNSKILQNVETQLSDINRGVKDNNRVAKDTNKVVKENKLQLNNLTALAHTILREVHKSRDVLLKGLFEETSVPTSFIILPHKLNESKANNNSSEYQDILSK